jgi:predicted small secreted protein
MPCRSKLPTPERAYPVGLFFSNALSSPEPNDNTHTTLMKTSITRIALLVFASAALTLVGTSCRTVRGFGQDVEHVGGHIEHAAR